MLVNHMNTCVLEAMKNDDDANREQKLEALVKLFRKSTGVIE